MQDIIKRYDRQLRTYGFDTINNFNKSSILIMGSINSYITEITKNASLSGINTIFIYNFNISEYKAYIELNDLNPHVKIINTNNYEQKQNVTIFIISENTYNLDFINNLNNYTRNINSSLIILFPYKIGGNIFVDFGASHVITDMNDEVINNVAIKNIGVNGIVKTITNHNYNLDNIITFNNLEGYNLDNLTNEWFIDEIIDQKSFKLKNFNINNFKFINGNTKQIKKSQIVNAKKYYEDDILKNTCTKYEDSIEPVVSILGSIVTSEAIKIITNKYMPINQWFNWEDTDLTNINTNLDNITLLIVGAGAIGCELVKNLGLISNNINIIIIDYDLIELSNLSRQFLFQDKHVGKLKCEVLADVMKEINPNINIKTLPLKVGTDNINFKEMNLTGVLMAVDNIEARKYMDSICLDLCIPMFDSGTEGMKGSTQPIIPFITELYSNSTDPITENSYPVCTIKTFPHNNIHTIYWALDQFETIFSEPILLDNYLNYSIDIFNQNYSVNINKLLLEHPIDEVLIDGTLYWSEGKKCPTEIQFNMLNEMHLQFINNTIKIISDNITKFDKENDLCIEWIMLASNLRALNYNIPLSDFNTTKGIAGKIIPAIPTTTSVVAGLTIIELIKYLYGSCDINYKSNFINLSIPMIICSEPIKAPLISICDVKINIWKKLNYTKNSMLAEFKKYYEEMFNININIIMFNDEIIYMENDYEYEKNLTKYINNILINSNNKINVLLSSTNNIELPEILIDII